MRKCSDGLAREHPRAVTEHSNCPAIRVVRPTDSAVSRRSADEMPLSPPKIRGGVQWIFTERMFIANVHWAIQLVCSVYTVWFECELCLPKSRQAFYWRSIDSDRILPLHVNQKQQESGRERLASEKAIGTLWQRVCCVKSSGNFNLYNVRVCSMMSRNNN